MPRRPPPAAKPLLTFALILAVVLSGGDAEARRSRYQPLPGHPWLQDRETGRYPHAQCELRVSVERLLPEPLTSAATGDLLEKAVLSAATVESADFEAAADPHTPSLPLPAQPFEVRCRTVLSEELAVPGAFEDRNIGRDENGNVAH